MATRPPGTVQETLSPRERATLSALCGALVPAHAGPAELPALYRLGALDGGVHDEIARAWAEGFPVDQRRAFRRLLGVVDSAFWNLLLFGRPVRFSQLTGMAQERFLLGMAQSRLGVKRQGFQAIKRMATFFYYSQEARPGESLLWADLGYVPAPRPRPEATGASAGVPAGILVPADDTALEADVCVIGSGAGGAVVAAMAAAAGRSVLILEAGPYRDRTSFSGREGESMRTMFQRQGLLTTRDLAIQVLAGETAGGSTTVNWMTCLRPSPRVREEWRAAGALAADGPTLDQDLGAVEERLHVGRTESDVNPANEVLRLGCERLGYAVPSDYDLIDRNALGCSRRCDFCPFGCVYDAKRSALVTYLADALAEGARLVCDARAERILIENGRARGVEARITRGGRSARLTVRARAVVVAAGAVQTPALLRRSGLTDPGVGTGLRLHPTTVLLGEFDRPIEPWKGPMQTVIVRRFVSSDVEEHGPWLESAPAHPGLAAAALPWEGGGAHKSAMARLARTAPTIVLVRDAGEGRVTTDREGETVLDYRLDRRDRVNLVRGLVEAARIHRAAGAVRLQTLHARPIRVGDGRAPISERELDEFVDAVERAGVVENALGLFSAHPTGSARIGTDPRRSAVGPEGECHGVANLWVGDGSLLPTAPGVNPMISIMAMARATARSVLRRLAGNP